MRGLKGNWRQCVALLAIGLAVFQLWTGTFGLMPSHEQRAVHVGLGTALVLLLYPTRKSGAGKANIPWWDILFGVLALASAANVFFRWHEYIPSMKAPATPFELALAAVLVFLLLEAGRRMIGWVFPALTAMAIIYALYGQYIPGQFGHAPIPWRVVFWNLYFQTEGIWGLLTGMSATYVAVFIIFGAILLATGGGKTFVDLAMIIAGNFRGGPAKVAVVGSGFIATLSGSPMANVATVGSYTIPMMKRLGYSAEFAAGVESIASTGGTITPPIMGAAAFVMAEFLNIPYLEVCAAAAIPALLYYVAVFMGVHFEAVKRNLLPIPRRDLPSLRSISISRVVGLIIPIGILIYTLFAGYSLTMVSTSGCIAALVLYIFSPPSPRSIRDKLRSLPGILEDSGKAVITIVPLLVCANVLLSLLNYTGVTITFSNLVVEVGKANLFMSVLMTAILLMVLGSGLPTTAAYIIGVVVAAPLLTSWGLVPIASHLFILYYANLEGITPPVCSTVWLAANIAKANWLKTSWVAMRLAPLVYVMPFIFLFDPTLIMIGAPIKIALNVAAACLGTVILVGGTTGQFITKCNIFESLLLVVAGILLLLPGLQTDLPGVLIACAIATEQLWRRRQRRGVLVGKS
jgi:TRAP transporter 4TM/12TM fusion protein